MPTYEFACTPCFERGVVSTWEMTFKVDEPKNTFCPKCGKPGHQVILTAPMVVKAETRERSKFSDKLVERELGARGITRIEQKRFDLEEEMSRHPSSSPPQDPFAIRAINPLEALAQGQGAGAHARAEAEFLGRDNSPETKVLGSFPKQIPTQVVAEHKGELTE